MANAVFNSFEDYLSKDTSNPVEHNSFDLSHIRSFCTTYGAIVPFYLEDCLPSDHFNISNVIKVQSLPMSNPLFNNIKVSTWYFYIPYYLLWRKFDLFISGGRDGTYVANLPYVETCPSHNSLADFFGFPITKDSTGSGQKYKVSAFPYAGYQMVFRDFFMNQDIQTSSNVNFWFPDDDDIFSLPDGLSYCMHKTTSDLPSRYNTWTDNGDGNNSSHPFFNTTNLDCVNYPVLQCIRFRNFQKDYFTSAMFSPQRGPLLGITSHSPWTEEQFQDIVSSGTGASLLVGKTTGSGYLPPNKFGTDSSANDVFVRSALANYANKIGNGITISDIMTASQIQLWMERNMQVKAQYNDFLRVHFGDAPLDERLTKPYYIGGTSQYINVNAVVQTSESSTTPQGTMTGLGHTVDSQFVGKFTSHEFGMILGVMCIMPDVYYTDGLSKFWTKESKFDFVFPELSQLPPEPIYNGELWYDNTISPPSPDTNKYVFGYSGRYDIYRHRDNMAVGDLRDPNKLDVYSWVIHRSFSSLPTLNSWSFINTLKTVGGVVSIPARTVSGGTATEYNNIPMDHFPTGNTQLPFIVQCGLKITASRPLPYRNEPQTLNLRRG